MSSKVSSNNDMTVNEIELSVVIPTFNRRDMLRDMLLTFCDQTLSPKRFEVIVVVDGSTDGTWEMFNELQTPFRLKPLYQENGGQGSDVFSSGVSIARNKGANAAEGGTLLFLDDDLLPRPELLEAHANFHRDDSRAVVLGRLLPAIGRYPNKKGWNVWEEEVLANHYRLMGEGDRPPAGWRLYSGNFSVNRRMFLEVGAFDLKLGHIRGEDVELGFRLEDAGAGFYFGSDAGAEHLGFRTFISWCNSAYILGPRDMALAKQMGRHELIPQMLQRYHSKSAVLKAVVQVTFNKRARRVAVAGLRVSAGIIERLKVQRLAHKIYSVIFQMQYWNGVADELGGRNGFNEFISGGKNGVRPSSQNELVG